MDKTKASKTMKAKSPSTASIASTSRKILSNKEKVVSNRTKFNKNTTVIGDADLTISKSQSCMPDFDSAHRQMAYGKFLRAMLEDCLVDEKITREETQMDVQITQLADRFDKTMEQLDKTNRRLKDINFVVEQQRLLELKNQDCATFYKMTDESNIETMISDLAAAERASLDKLETKNVDFGYNKESGHKQLLDAVNETIDGLEEIKKYSNLNMEKLKEYEKSRSSLDDVEKDRFDLSNLKSEFDKKFPNFSDKLIMEASAKISAMIDDDDD